MNKRERESSLKRVLFTCKWFASDLGVVKEVVEEESGLNARGRVSLVCEFEYVYKQWVLSSDEYL